MFADLSDAFEGGGNIGALWKSLCKLQHPPPQGPQDPSTPVTIPPTVTIPTTATGTLAPTTTSALAPTTTTTQTTLFQQQQLNQHSPSPYGNQQPMHYLLGAATGTAQSLALLLQVGTPTGQQDLTNLFQNLQSHSYTH